MLPKILPPNLGIVRTVKHLRQFLLDLPQAIGSQLEGGLVDWRMLALFRKTSIHLPQIGDFLAKAGEVFRDIRHLLDDTPLLAPPSLYLSPCREGNRLYLRGLKPLGAVT